MALAAARNCNARVTQAAAAPAAAPASAPSNDVARDDESDVDSNDDTPLIHLPRGPLSPLRLLPEYLKTAIVPWHPYPIFAGWMEPDYLEDELESGPGFPLRIACGPLCAMS